MIKVISFILELLFEIASAVFTGFIEFIESLIGQERKTEYDADFVPANEILSKFDKGFCLTGSHCLSITESYKIVLLSVVPVLERLPLYSLIAHY